MKRIIGSTFFFILIVVMALVSYFLRDYARIFAVFNYIFRFGFIVYIIGIVLLIFIDKNSPSATISWLLVMYFMPYVGLAFYIFMGRNFISKRRIKDYEKKYYNINSKDEFSSKISELIYYKDKLPVCKNNKVEVINSGSVKFEKFIEDIRKAKSHIHMEYYIFRDDLLGKQIIEELLTKVREGVDVKILVDDVGSWQMKKKTYTMMRKNGIEIEFFSPVFFPILTRELNYRNHRKIVVIDNLISYVGGINIGDEYLGLSKKFGNWVDTHLRIEGEASNYLQLIFLNDWMAKTGQEIDVNEFYVDYTGSGESEIQIVSSGPDEDYDLIRDVYVAMFNNATDKIWITTPYFVPDECIMNALKLASNSGIDVRVIVPEKKDHFWVYWATRDNIQELLENGVKVYLYTDGFIHKKTILTDREASVGTANMDIRSFTINYEVNAVIYDKPTRDVLEEHFVKDLEKCREIDYDSYNSRSIFVKALEAIARLTAPLQ